MAIAAGVQLGTRATSGSGLTTCTLTTANTVPANSFLIVCAETFFSGVVPTAMTCSGGSLTWTTDKLLVGSADLCATASLAVPVGAGERHGADVHLQPPVDG